MDLVVLKLDRDLQSKAVMIINEIGWNPCDKPIGQWEWSDYQLAARLRDACRDGETLRWTDARCS